MGMAVLKAVRLSLCFVSLALAACDEGRPAPDRGHTDAASAELCDAPAGIFTRLEDMTTPRQSHTATPLHDGRVLITGGYGPDGPLRSAEIYDPDTNEFRRTGNLNLARYKLRGTSVLQENGRVVVADVHRCSPRPRGFGAAYCCAEATRAREDPPTTPGSSNSEQTYSPECVEKLFGKWLKVSRQ